LFLSVVSHYRRVVGGAEGDCGRDVGCRADHSALLLFFLYSGRIGSYRSSLGFNVP
jgi:hypothetical protein